MTADTVGGVWTYALDLARALAPHDGRVVLATMGAPVSASQRAELAVLPNVELRESRFRLEWMEDPWDEVERAGEWLLALERAERPDVIHLNGFVHAALPWRGTPLVCAHSCVLSWWRAVHRADAPPSWDQYRESVRAGVQAAGVVVAPTRAMLGAVRAHYGEPRDGRVVHNGRDPRPFRPAPKEPFIMGAGRLWDEGKNVGALDSAAAALDWPVYVAGAARAPEGGKTGFTAARPLGRLGTAALAGLLGRAAVFAHPARYEPFGLVVLEAALSRCALVLSDIDSMRELWDGAARFVPADDSDALRVALAELTRDAAERERLAGAARARAGTFTLAAMATGYLAAYAALTAAPPPCAALPREPRSRAAAGGPPKPAAHGHHLIATGADAAGEAGCAS